MKTEAVAAIAAARDAIAAVEVEVERLIDVPPPVPRRTPAGYYYKCGYGADPIAAVERIPSHFAGLMIEEPWGWAETSRGRARQFHRILTACEAAYARGMSVWWWVQIKGFGATRDCTPTDITPFQHHSKPAFMAPIFQPDTLSRWVDFLDAAGRAVGAHPALVAVDTSESAPGDLLPQDLWPALFTGLTTQYTEIASAFPQVACFANINFWREIDVLINAAYTAGCEFAATDAKGTAASRRPAGMKLICQASGGVLRASGIEGAYGWARTNGAVAMSWVDPLDAPNDWAAIVEFTAANPL